MNPLLTVIYKLAAAPAGGLFPGLDINDPVKPPAAPAAPAGGGLFPGLDINKVAPPPGAPPAATGLPTEWKPGAPATSPDPYPDRTAPPAATGLPTEWKPGAPATSPDPYPDRTAPPAPNPVVGGDFGNINAPDMSKSTMLPPGLGAPVDEGPMFNPTPPQDPVVSAPGGPPVSGLDSSWNEAPAGSVPPAPGAGGDWTSGAPVAQSVADKSWDDVDTTLAPGEAPAPLTPEQQFYKDHKTTFDPNSRMDAGKMQKIRERMAAQPAAAAAPAAAAPLTPEQQFYKDHKTTFDPNSRMDAGKMQKIRERMAAQPAAAAAPPPAPEGYAGGSGTVDPAAAPPPAAPAPPAAAPAPPVPPLEAIAPTAARINRLPGKPFGHTPPGVGGTSQPGNFTDADNAAYDSYHAPTDGSWTKDLQQGRGAAMDQASADHAAATDRYMREIDSTQARRLKLQNPAAYLKFQEAARRKFGITGNGSYDTALRGARGVNLAQQQAAPPPRVPVSRRVVSQRPATAADYRRLGRG